MPNDPAPKPIRPDDAHAAFSPTPPPGPTERREWWGYLFSESLWPLELARSAFHPAFRDKGIARGEGSPVMLIPGFLAHDGTMSVLAGWLSGLDYDVYGSGTLLNAGCSDAALDRLDRRLAVIAGHAGGPVALVGMSRGGHLARALAHRRPERLSAVVAIGSGLGGPFDISIPTRTVVGGVRWLHRRVTNRSPRSGCMTVTCGCRFARHFTAELPADLPLTCIYSRRDGVVWWESCIVPGADNVEVKGASHVGLAFNGDSLRAVAEALAQRRRGPRAAPAEPRGPRARPAVAPAAAAISSASRTVPPASPAPRSPA